MVKIVPYNQTHREAFRSLNEGWIRQYFKMEENDIRALGDPESYILEKGGEILVAVDNDAVLGVCALLPTRGKETLELAKMAVAPEARGKKVGYTLGLAILDLAKRKKARRVYLESNTILKPAIHLYQKLGFEKIEGGPSPYERCNIQMEYNL